MPDFAKIFVIDGRQLLVYWECDGDESILKTVTHVSFGSICGKRTYAAADTAAKVFELFDEEKAKEQLTEFVKLEQTFENGGDDD